MRSIGEYLEKKDPETAAAAYKAIQCFEPYRKDEQAYARFSLSRHNCRDEVVALLKEISIKKQFPEGDREAGFNAEQNALIAVNAEKYYSRMLDFNNESWNIRDTHMMETLSRLMQFHGADAKGIVWAHNTHIGDARATDMKDAGMVNLGQLARETYGKNTVYLAGFASYKETVIAGSRWGAHMQVMEVPKARRESIEATLHSESSANRYYIFEQGEADERFCCTVPHRAIGVVYHPRSEQYGNYVPSVMSNRYDALLYLDETTALHPIASQVQKQHIPDTYPFGV